MARMNWDKAKKYKSDNYDYINGKSLSFKEQEKLENRRVNALIFIQSYQGNSNFINSLKSKRLLSIKQIQVIEEIQKNLKD
jgi:hypothetical protein